MYFLIAISWLIIITFLHFIPGPDLPQSYWSIIFQIDKIVHAFIFCVGVYLFAIALSQKQKKSFLTLLISLFILYGLMLELVQELFFVYRTADLFDWLFDIIGAFLGGWIFMKFPILVPVKSFKKD